MVPLHTVEKQPSVSIIVPPGERTVVVVRPRGAAWDLLPLRLTDQPSAGPVFANFPAAEAADLARRFELVLESDHVISVSTPDSPWCDGYVVGITQLDLFWVACPRRPGQPYVALVFTTKEEAEAAARSVAARLISVI